MANGRAIGAFVAASVCAAIIGCGGGGGGGGHSSTSTSSTSTSTTSSAGTPAANVIVYGVTGSGSTYNIDEMTPAGTNSVLMANVPSTISLFALNPNTTNSYVMAVNPPGFSSFGIYVSSAGVTTTGATEIVAPSYAFVSSLSVSANGQTVIFTGEDATGNSYLFTVPIAGGTVTKLALADGATISPADNDTIAYVGLPSSGVYDQLFTRSLAAGAGGTPTQLTTDAISHSLPAFSRDGTKLAYWESGPSGNTLFVDTLVGSPGLNPLPNPTGVNPQGEAFNSDGTQLAIVADLNGQGQILTQPSAGSTAPTVLSTQSNLVGNYGVYWTNANGRVVGGSMGMSSVARRQIVKSIRP